MPTFTPAEVPLFRALDSLVDHDVGIIRLIRDLPREPGSPNFFHFYAKACNAKQLGGESNFSDAGGASSIRQVALAKAIGEAVERYCAAFYWVDDLTFGSFKSVTGACAPPETFSLYSNGQYKRPDFPYVPFHQDSPIHWVSSTNLMTQNPYFVPASMVYLPYRYHNGVGEHKITQRISTGLACHGDFFKATISAINEVIERDAFSITWQAKISPPKIIPNTLSEANLDLVDRFIKTGFLVTCLDITTDVEVPTVLSVLTNENSEQPAMVFAAASDLDPELAVRKSLEELAHTQRLAARLKKHRKGATLDYSPENVRSRDDHVYFYCLHENAPHADFILNSKKEVSLSSITKLGNDEPEKDLHLLIERIKKVGETVYVCDLTTSDIKDLGLFVVRAVIPGFHPLFMGHTNRALGGKRLWAIPQKLGYQGITPQTGDNPFPHPYP